MDKLEELVLYLDAKLRRVEEAILRLERMLEPNRAERRRRREAAIYV